MDVASLDTPVATIDLDAVERNIGRMQGYCDEHSLAFRPHIKTHKLPAIAHMQLRAGAVGITCQKLGEAEVMEAAGVRDILLTFPLVGAAKAERLAALAGEATISVVGDSDGVARGLSPALARAGVEVGFLVEVDTGFARTGVQTPQAAAELAEIVESLPGLRFDGLMTYPTLPGTGPILRAAIDEISSRGLEVRTVSGGRHADVLQESRGAGDHRGARRNLCVRRSFLHRERLGPARGLRAPDPRDRGEPADGRAGNPRLPARRR